jgi:RNA polymerase sigma-70 factor (ECF subfamily)
MTVRDALALALGPRAELLDAACAAWNAGATRWPTARVAPAALAARIVARADATTTGDGGTPTTGREFDADLYLATALAAGDGAAVAAFEHELLPQVDAALTRLRLAPVELDELKQALRVDLLVGDGQRPGKISSYLGHGPLAAWLRVSAIRRGLSMKRQGVREESLEELVIAGWPDASRDPAARHLRHTYTEHLKAALTAALAGMTARERNLLRHSIIDELTVDELALMYRVHRSTCARWLVDARATLGRATRRALSDALGPIEGQADSVLRLVESDVELSLSRLMRDAGAGALAGG